MRLSRRRSASTLPRHRQRLHAPRRKRLRLRGHLSAHAGIEPYAEVFEAGARCHGSKRLRRTSCRFHGLPQCGDDHAVKPWTAPPAYLGDEALCHGGRWPLAWQRRARHARPTMSTIAMSRRFPRLPAGRHRRRDRVSTHRRAARDLGSADRADDGNLQRGESHAYHVQPFEGEHRARVRSPSTHRRIICCGRRS